MQILQRFSVTLCLVRKRTLRNEKRTCRQGSNGFLAHQSVNKTNRNNGIQLQGD